MKSRSFPKRILLKLSGETLLGDQSFGINQTACMQVAAYIEKIHKMNLELGLVIGGGNIFRAIDLKGWGMPRTPADHMGMLATLFNGVALKQALLLKGVETVLMSAIDCPTMAEPYNWDKAMKYLKEKIVVIFVGGTGVPYFTTDTAAALRASEIRADVLYKATKVDGAYNKDPKYYPDAVKYSRVTYSQVLAEKLQVMDATAIALCQSNHVPIFVFNMQRLHEENLEPVLFDYDHGTLISEDDASLNECFQVF